MLPGRLCLQQVITCWWLKVRQGTFMRFAALGTKYSRSVMHTSGSKAWMRSMISRTYFSLFQSRGTALLMVVLKSTL